MVGILGRLLHTHWRDVAALIGIVALIFGSLAAVLKFQARSVIPIEQWVSENTGTDGHLRPLADIVQLRRHLKLLTATIESRTEVRMEDPSWRGMASATVRAPVIYRFCIDLEKLENNSLRRLPLTNRYVLVVPEPSLQDDPSVDGSRMEEQIDVTGTRFKKLSGRDQAELARKAIYEKARSQVLPLETLGEVRQASRQQVEQLMRNLLGNQANIRVRFLDE